MIKLNRDFLAGAVLGFGAGFLTASSKIIQDKKVKETVKSILKTGLIGFEKVREEVMRKAETLEDLFVEARSEVKSEAKQAETHAVAGNVDNSSQSNEQSPTPGASSAMSQDSSH